MMASHQNCSALIARKRIIIRLSEKEAPYCVYSIPFVHMVSVFYKGFFTFLSLKILRNYWIISLMVPFQIDFWEKRVALKMFFNFGQVYFVTKIQVDELGVN